MSLKQSLAPIIMSVAINTAPCMAKDGDGSSGLKSSVSEGVSDVLMQKKEEKMYKDIFVHLKNLKYHEFKKKTEIIEKTAPSLAGSAPEYVKKYITGIKVDVAGPIHAKLLEMGAIESDINGGYYDGVLTFLALQKTPDKLEYFPVEIFKDSCHYYWGEDQDYGCAGSTERIEQMEHYSESNIVPMITKVLSKKGLIEFQTKIEKIKKKRIEVHGMGGDDLEALWVGLNQNILQVLAFVDIARVGAFSEDAFIAPPSLSTPSRNPTPFEEKTMEIIEPFYKIIARLYDFQVSNYSDRLANFERHPIRTETRRITYAIVNEAGNPIYNKLLSVGLDNEDLQDGKYALYLDFLVMQGLIDTKQFSLNPPRNR